MTAFRQVTSHAHLVTSPIVANLRFVAPCPCCCCALCLAWRQAPQAARLRGCGCQAAEDGRRRRRQWRRRGRQQRRHCLNLSAAGQRSGRPGHAQAGHDPDVRCALRGAGGCGVGRHGAGGRCACCCCCCCCCCCWGHRAAHTADHQYLQYLLCCCCCALFEESRQKSTAKPSTYPSLTLRL